MESAGAAAERIVAAARREFFLHGFRQVTMDEIARQLGISKKTLYGSFASKTALIEAVIVDKFAELESDLDQVAAQSVDVAAGLGETLACLQRHAGEIQPAFLRDVGRAPSGLFELAQARRNAVITQHFAKMLRQGRRSGVVRSDVPLELVIQVLQVAVQNILTPANLATLGLSPRDGVAAVVSVFLEGVLTAKGRSPS
ncbi:MAG: TetR/AcrR family transcriptional regulator [Pirellulales bacterium]|nr:TetR/AcrR family transcriptional regulator [Pirellulales bacterium]